MINEVRFCSRYVKSNNFVLQVEKKGVIYFEDVCKLILRKFREDDESEFIKIMFKVGLILRHNLRQTINNANRFHIIYILFFCFMKISCFCFVQCFILLVCRQFILCLVAPLTQVPNFHYWGSLTLTTSYVSRQKWRAARFLAILYSSSV